MTIDHRARAAAIVAVMERVAEGRTPSREDQEWIVWALGVAYQHELNLSRTSSVETLKAATAVVQGAPADSVADECFWFAGAKCTCGQHPSHEWKFSKEG